MSIRLKLIITYIFCVLFSAGVIVISMFVGTTRFFHAAVNEIVDHRVIDVALVEVIDILAELKQAEDSHEELLIDKEYMEDINDRLLLFNSGLIVLHKEEYMNFTKYEDIDELISHLHITPTAKERVDENLNNINPNSEGRDTWSMKHPEGDDMNQSFSIGERSYFYIDRGFVVENEPVIYFFVTDTSGLQDLNSNIRKGVGFAILVLVMLMILPVILLVQFDIIRPLKQLERGAVEIGKGNLDFKITSKSKNEVGKVLSSYEIMREELKKSIEKQIKYENNRKELISSISHDLKTPITSIKGYIEGILDDVANTEEKRERYLKVIHQKSMDMDRLIDDLFTFSKLDLNKLPFEFEKINMEAFMRDVWDELSYEYREAAVINLKVDNHTDDNADKVHLEDKLYIDVQQMKRVMLNLVQNSIKYNNSKEKRVELIYENYVDKVIITIKDNGIGMESEELQNAFDMFYRSDDSRNTNTGGSGLGLAIVKQIILEHKGKIRAKSSKSKGTSISIELEKLVEV